MLPLQDTLLCRCGDHAPARLLLATDWAQHRHKVWTISAQCGTVFARRLLFDWAKAFSELSVIWGSTSLCLPPSLLSFHPPPTLLFSFSLPSSFPLSFHGCQIGISVWRLSLLNPTPSLAYPSQAFSQWITWMSNSALVSLFGDSELAEFP